MTLKNAPLKIVAIIDPGFKSGKEPYLKKILNLHYQFILIINQDVRAPVDPWWNDYFSPESIFPVSFRDPSKSNLPFAHGYYTYFEEAVPLTNYLALKYNATPIASGEILTLRHKGKMRDALTKSGLPQPWFHVLQNENDLYAISHSLPLPCVVKPAEMMASIGVKKVTNEKDLLNAYNDAKNADIPEDDTKFAYHLSSDVVIEQYLPADYEMSCEVVVQNGNLIDFFPTGKILGNEPYFVEIGHWHPLHLSEALRDKLNQSLLIIIETFKIQSVILHAEFRIKNDIPYLIEVAARTAGDFIPFIVEKALGVDLISMGIKLCVDEAIDAKPLFQQHSAIIFLDSSVKIRSARETTGHFSSTITEYDHVVEGRAGHVILDSTKQISIAELPYF